MDWRYLFDSFDGRIGRQTFWIAMAVLGCGQLVGYIIAELIEGDRLNAIVDLAFTYPEFAVAVKRGNDRNLPFWLVAILFGAGALLDLLVVMNWAGTTDQPSLPAIIISVLFTVLGFGLLIELGFRRGTVGPNQHGPDPLAKS